MKVTPAPDIKITNTNSFTTRVKGPPVYAKFSASPSKFSDIGAKKRAVREF